MWSKILFLSLVVVTGCSGVVQESPSVEISGDARMQLRRGDDAAPLSPSEEEERERRELEEFDSLYDPLPDFIL